MAIPGYDRNRKIYPGLNRTAGGLGGDMPQQTLTGRYTVFYKRLYKSPREIAILLDKTFRKGYGCLPIGTVLAKDENTDKLVPYTPDEIDQDKDYSRVFLLNDCDTADSFDVDITESYKLQEDDEIVLTDRQAAGSPPSTFETATIDSIDRTTYNHKAVVTLTGAVSGTFTTALLANCYVKAEDAASGNKCSKARYILDMEVDTGAGEDAVGGLGAVLLSNAVIYQEDVELMDAQAITDLGNVTSDGVYYILK